MPIGKRKGARCISILLLSGNICYTVQKMHNLVDWRGRGITYLIIVAINDNVCFTTSIFIGKSIFSGDLKCITFCSLYCLRFITSSQFQVIKPTYKIIWTVVLRANLKCSFFSLGIERTSN